MGSAGRRQTYVFHLEEGVKFHDEMDFDAEVAKWNIDRILDPEVKSWVRPYYEQIDKVEVVDKYTLRIRMKDPLARPATRPGRVLPGYPTMASRKAFETYGKDWVRIPLAPAPIFSRNGFPAST